MKWSDFTAAVLVDLPVDNDRINVATGTPNYLEHQILYSVIEIQKLIPFYQNGHETIYGPNDLVRDGLASVGSLPVGQQCRPLDAYYKKVGKQCMSQPFVQYPWSSRYDLVCGAPRVTNCQFLMAIDPWGQQFTVFPSVGDLHQISLFWNGVKTSFVAADETPFDMDVVEIVGLFVKGKIARLVDHDLQENASYMMDYFRKRSLLYATTLERARISFGDDSPAPGNKCGNTISPCQDTGAVCGDSSAPNEDTVEFVAFGDSSYSDNTNTNSVSILAKSLEPDFIMHMGDCNYPAGDPVTLQDNLVKYYGMYIPASFYLAFGNHDIQTDGGATLRAMLTAQAALNAGLTYYDYIPQAETQPGTESCHIFVLDTNLPVAAQAAWLQPKLEASDLWNIVVLHQAPYTSDLIHAPGNINFRLPYRTWGAHLVLAGHAHNYERLLVDELVYVNCGLGGNLKRGFVSPAIAGSQFRYNDFYGCLWVTARTEQLQVTFYDTRGVNVDSFALKNDEVIVA